MENSRDSTNPTPILLIISAPSGAGKTTLIEKLIIAKPDIHLTISATTRAPRAGEKNGIHYHFINVEKFESKIKSNEFAEYAKVYENYYGTPKSEIDIPLAVGKDVVAEVDWQGAASLRQIYPKAVSIFIMPPSREELKKRLITRGKDNEDTINKRLAEYDLEVAKADDFDFILVNDDFNKSAEKLVSLYQSAHLLQKKKP